MTPIPVKNSISLSDTIEELVANFGARKVFFEIAARLFRKMHPPDQVSRSTCSESLPDYLRKDIGLPPKIDGTQQHVSPVAMHKITQL